MRAVLFRGLRFKKTMFQQEIDRTARDGIVDSARREWNCYGIKKPVCDALSVKGFNFGESLWDDGASPPFACGDLRGASRYAAGRSDEKGAVLRLEVDIDEIYVDGRDFLIFAFQIADQWIDRQPVRRLMAEAFGSRILEWAERAAMQSGPSQTDLRINVACHACRDPHVIRAHLVSKVVLFGKANFQFCSAFRFNTPVAAEQIRVLEPEPLWTDADVRLSFSMMRS